MLSHSSSRLYLSKYVHAKIVKPAVSKSVSPAAIKIILLLYPQIDTPISNANTNVKAMKIGRANFLKASVAHEIKHDNPINNTDKMMIMGVFIKTVLNAGLLYAQYPIATVTNS